MGFFKSSVYINAPYAYLIASTQTSALISVNDNAIVLKSFQFMIKRKTNIVWYASTQTRNVRR